MENRKIYRIRTPPHCFWLHQKFHLIGINFSLKVGGGGSVFLLFNIYLVFKEVSHQVEFLLNGHALDPAYRSLSVYTRKDPTRHKWTQVSSFHRFAMSIAYSEFCCNPSVLFNQLARSQRISQKYSSDKQTSD